MLWKKFVIGLLFIMLVFVVNAFVNPIPLRLRSGSSTQDKKLIQGFTYSFEQAGWYGLDSRQTYLELLDELKVDWVRIPFFWDQMTHLSQGFGGQAEYDLRIDDLKFAIEEAQKRNIKVVVVLGAKTPYHPEYHLPQNISNQLKFGDHISDDHPIADDILNIDKKLVEELSTYDNISHWQVENEAFLANINNWKIDKNLLTKEINVVRSTDPLKRPIILTTASHPSFDNRHRDLFELLQPGDVLGISTYFKIEGVNLFSFSIFNKQINVPWPDWFVWPVQSWMIFSPNYESIAKQAHERGLQIWAIEMQAEPYIRTLDQAKESEFGFDATDIKKGYEFLRSVDFDGLGMWGVQFAKYREKIGDDSWINEARSLTL